MSEQTIKTIENVDELFSQIEVNGELFTSNKVIKNEQTSVPPVVTETEKETEADVPKPKVTGQEVIAVDLNNTVHPLRDESTYTKSEVDELIAGAGKVKTVNHTEPDADGNIELDIDFSPLEREIADIKGVIPEQASVTNKLADKDFVNSSINTNTANFIGTFTSLEELERQPATNNDYAFFVTTDSDGNIVYKRYKYVSVDSSWQYEYDLNNSSFTAEQWASIQSGITAELVAKLDGIEEGAQVNVQSNWSQTDSTKDDFIKNKPAVVNNLTSTSNTDVLSASQGKALNDSKLPKDASSTALTWKDEGNTDVKNIELRLSGNSPSKSLSLVTTKSDDTKVFNTLINADGSKAWGTGNGTITGITMNGNSMGTSGTVNLGTVLTSHQDISGKLDVSGSNGTAEGVSALINKLSTGTSTPSDNDYYVSQYVGGGTTTTTYHRRPVSALWQYTKSKIQSVFGIKGFTGKISLTGTTIVITCDGLVTGHPTQLFLTTDTQFDLRNQIAYTVRINGTTMPSSMSVYANNRICNASQSLAYTFTFYVGTLISAHLTSNALKLRGDGYAVENANFATSASSASSSTSANYAYRATQTVDRFISYCSTTANAPAKIASCDNYALRTGDVFVLVNTVANTYTGAITLNVNSKGAKAVYLNGVASSSSNYNLPIGTYFVYYDGTRYYINTDGSYPAPVKDSNPIGTIIAFAGSVPTGYLLCNGQAVSRTTYADLYAVIGTKYGAGNGSTTFNVPNLVEKFPMGAGSSTATALGKTLDAGLPNITGGVNINTLDTLREGSGCISRNGGAKAGDNISLSGNGGVYEYAFNASVSSPIYGNSTTVQPPATTVNYCIKALNASGGISTNAVLDDTVVSANKLWSSNKINSELTSVNNNIAKLPSKPTLIGNIGNMGDSSYNYITLPSGKTWSDYKVLYFSFISGSSRVLHTGVFAIDEDMIAGTNSASTNLQFQYGSGGPANGYVYFDKSNRRIYYASSACSVRIYAS